MEWPIRQAVISDLGFITDSWRKLMYSQYPLSKLSREAKEKYSAKIHTAVGLCRTLVCSDPKDDGLIYGYINFDQAINCVHMIYVRASFRGHRIGTALIFAAFENPIDLKYSAHTKYTEALKGLKHYDPYLLD